MEPSLLRSLRAYLQSQQDHLLAQQTEQEWLLGEITTSLEATQLRLKETRQMLASLSQSAQAPSGGTLAAFLPSLLPNFLQSTFYGNNQQAPEQPEQPQPQQQQPQQEQAASRKRSASLSALDEVDEDDGDGNEDDQQQTNSIDHTVSSPAPAKKARHSKKAPRPPMQRSVTVHKTTHLTTTGTILHGVAHVTSVVNEAVPSSSHANCTAPLPPANAPKPRRIASVEVDLSKIPGFDAHVTRQTAGKARETTSEASGSGHRRTPSLPQPPPKGQ